MRTFHAAEPIACPMDSPLSHEAAIGNSFYFLEIVFPKKIAKEQRLVSCLNTETFPLLSQDAAHQDQHVDPRLTGGPQPKHKNTSSLFSCLLSLRPSFTCKSHTKPAPPALPPADGRPAERTPLPILNIASGSKIRTEIASCNLHPLLPFYLVAVMKWSLSQRKSLSLS